MSSASASFFCQEPQLLPCRPIRPMTLLWHCTPPPDQCRYQQTPPSLRGLSIASPCIRHDADPVLHTVALRPPRRPTQPPMFSFQELPSVLSLLPFSPPPLAVAVFFFSPLRPPPCPPLRWPHRTHPLLLWFPPLPPLTWWRMQACRTVATGRRGTMGTSR